METSEQWKSIPGYETSYEVSSLGRVRSIDRTISSGAKRKGRLIHQANQNSGYLIVSLWKSNKGKMCLVHRLVMLAFVGSAPLGYEVHHIDHNKHNNHLSNLRYVTSSENNIEAIRAGRLRPPVFRGVDSAFAKLTEDEVIEIRFLYTTGNYSQSTLARMFRVAKPTIKDILKRRSWKHI